MNISQKVAKRLLIGYLGFGGIGFCRGIQIYNYEYQTDLNKYKDFYNDNNKKYIEYCKENPYLYKKAVASGIFNMAFYLWPILNIISLFKELERIEMDVRGLERNKKYYDKI